jgi:hypothetical protein
MRKGDAGSLGMSNLLGSRMQSGGAGSDNRQVAENLGFALLGYLQQDKDAFLEGRLLGDCKVWRKGFKTWQPVTALECFNPFVYAEELPPPVPKSEDGNRGKSMGERQPVD